MNDPQRGPVVAGALDLSGLVRKRDAPSAPSGSAGVVRVVDDRSVAALVELSKTIPIILEVHSAAIEPVLGPVVESYAGRLVLGTVLGESAPELVRALQIEGVPTVLAVVAGQPIPLFTGIPSPEEVRKVLDQVLVFATENGVTGALPLDPQLSAQEETLEPPLPPAHQEAFDALSRGDLSAAKAAYQKALAGAPADADAEAGLAHVELLERVQDVDQDVARGRAKEHPEDLGHALVLADLDISGGRYEDAFTRLLGLFPTAGDEDREALRERLLSYFTIVGHSASEVKKARTQLASLMF